MAGESLGPRGRIPTAGRAVWRKARAALGPRKGGLRHAAAPAAPDLPGGLDGSGGLDGLESGQQHPFKRGLVLSAVALVGAWLGLVVVGAVSAPVGPVDTRMSLHPSFTGGTNINVSPLGALDLSSHRGPVRLDVDVRRLNPERAQNLVNHPERISGLEDEVAGDTLSGVVFLAVRSAAVVFTGATAVGLVVYRRPRRAMAAGGLALALLAASGLTAFATWNPKSVLEPRFSGLLSSAPSVVGNAQSIVSDFDVYGQELARLVTNVTKLYDATSTLPAYQPDPSTVRLLHVSDIHLNPASWQIIGSIVDDYGVDVIVDTGDTMDHGTAAENRFTEAVSDLGAPYVWVRGNHDSMDTQKAMETRDGVLVADEGKVVSVAGLRIAGIGDPQFTPDRSVKAEGDPVERQAGRTLDAAIRAQREPVDIAIAHNPVAVSETDGTVPLALAGHTHNRKVSVLEDGTRLFVQGSTGGGGLRAVEGDEPAKVQASVLYLDRETRRLQAWDDITLGGLGLTTAEITRHLAEEERGEVTPGTTPPSPAGDD